MPVCVSFDFHILIPLNEKIAVSMASGLNDIFLDRKNIERSFFKLKR
jgi:hypothetical protein